ncbi:MAG: DUF3298 domain-containing protein [Minisyncoccia bacterium]
MELKKFYFGRTLGFLIVLIIIFLGGYYLKNKDTVVLDVTLEEKAGSSPISITDKEINEENFSGSVASVSGSSILAEKAEEYIQTTISEFRIQADRDVPDMRAEFGADNPSANYSIEIRASRVVGEKSESIIISIYTYTGGAHGNSAYKVITASAEDGRILSLSDIITAGKEGAFTEYIKKELKDWRPEGGPSGVFPEEVDNLKFESFTNWSLEENFLVMFFSQYEIGPGVLGPVAFPVSLEKIKDFLK